MSSISTPSDFGNLTTWEELKRWLSAWAVDTTTQINGNIDFTSNIKCKIVDVSFKAANTDTTIRHQLKKIPTGYIVVRSNVAAVVYDGSVEFSTLSLTLKSSAIAECSILIF